MNEIKSSREKLYAGQASAKLYKYALAKKPFPLDLTVCGSRAATCAVTETPGPHAAGQEVEGKGGPSVPRGKNSPLGEVLVGARVHATLTTHQKGVRVRSDSSTEQVIATPEDVGEWRWTVEASGSGVFSMQIAVTTLKEDTDLALIPTRYFDIAITVRDSPASVIQGAGSRLWAFVGGAAGLAALMAASVGYLVHRHNRSVSVAGAAATAPAPSRPSGVKGSRKGRRRTGRG